MSRDAGWREFGATRIGGLLPRHGQVPRVIALNGSFPPALAFPSLFPCKLYHRSAIKHAVLSAEGIHSCPMVDTNGSSPPRRGRKRNRQEPEPTRNPRLRLACARCQRRKIKVRKHWQRERSLALANSQTSVGEKSRHARIARMPGWPVLMVRAQGFATCHGATSEVCKAV